VAKLLSVTVFIRAIGIGKYFDLAKVNFANAFRILMLALPKES
jgi:hypothetical protein